MIVTNPNGYACELLYDFNNTTPNISRGNIGASGNSTMGFYGTIAPSTQHTIYFRFKYNGNYSSVWSYTFNTSSPTNYTITFNANGGNTPSPASKSVAYWSTYGTLATTSRSGYIFNGWFTAASGGTKITSSTQMTQTANHTLYAQWSAAAPTWVFISENSSPWYSHTVTLYISNWANRVAEAKQYLDTNYPARNYAEYYGISVQVEIDIYLDFQVRYV